MITRLWPTLLALTLLSACAAPAQTATEMGTPTPATAVSAPAPTFTLITDPQAIIAALPPALDAADVDAPPIPADPATLDAWKAPIARWRATATTAARLDGADDDTLAAELRTFNLALNDGLALAALARSQGYAVSDDAVTAELAWRLIAHSHPLRADTAHADADIAAWVGFWHDDATAPAVVTGRHLGAAAAQVISAAWDARPTPAAQ